MEPDDGNTYFFKNKIIHKLDGENIFVINMKISAHTVLYCSVVYNVFRLHGAEKQY